MKPKQIGLSGEAKIRLVEEVEGVCRMKVMQRCLAVRDASTKQVAEGKELRGPLSLLFEFIYLIFIYYFKTFWAFIAGAGSLIADSRGYSQ